MKKDKTKTRTGNRPESSLQTLKEQEKKLIEMAARGDKESLESLINKHRPFIARTAREFAFSSLTQEDLIQEGIIGLIQAIHNFDTSKDVRFMTYAIWWVRRTMLRAFHNKSLTVRIPRYRYKQYKDIRNATEKLNAGSGGGASVSEIASKLKMKESEIGEMVGYYSGGISIDAPVQEGENQSPMSRVMTRSDDINQEERILFRESLDLLYGGLMNLSPRERAILIHRFGLTDAGETMTLDQIGRKVRLTRERVRQIEVQAKRKLKEFFLAKVQAGAKGYELRTESAF